MIQIKNKRKGGKEEKCARIKKNRMKGVREEKEQQQQKKSI